MTQIRSTPTPVTLGVQQLFFEGIYSQTGFLGISPHRIGLNHINLTFVLVKENV